jgi:formate/nitrite transporter FocA (FNT family)
MLLLYLLLGISAAVVVSVALALYVRVRRQMKHSAAHRTEHNGAELDGTGHLPPHEN